MYKKKTCMFTRATTYDIINRTYHGGAILFFYFYTFFLLFFIFYSLFFSLPLSLSLFFIINKLIYLKRWEDLRNTFGWTTIVEIRRKKIVVEKVANLDCCTRDEKRNCSLRDLETGRWYGCCLSNTVTRNGHRRGNIRKRGYSGCVAMPDRTPQPPANRELLLYVCSRALKLLERRLRYFWDADGAARLEIRAVFSSLDVPAISLSLFLPVSLKLIFIAIVRLWYSYASWIIASFFLFQWSWTE